MRSAEFIAPGQGQYLSSWIGGPQTSQKFAIVVSLRGSATFLNRRSQVLIFLVAIAMWIGVIPSGQMHTGSSCVQAFVYHHPRGCLWLWSTVRVCSDCPRTAFASGSPPESCRAISWDDGCSFGESSDSLFRPRSEIKKMGPVAFALLVENRLQALPQGSRNPTGDDLWGVRGEWYYYHHYLRRTVGDKGYANWVNAKYDFVEAVRRTLLHRYHVGTQNHLLDRYIVF